MSCFVSQCDETRPQCERCHAYGVACNFAHNVADLQPLLQSQVTQEVFRQSRIRLTPSQALTSNTIWSSNESSFLSLDRQDRELFYQFRCRTVRSLSGNALVHTLENRICRDSFSVSVNEPRVFRTSDFALLVFVGHLLTNESKSG
jgi:hypothetical protein